MNYANEISIYGMLPTYAVMKGSLSFYKNKRKQEIISFDESFRDDSVNISYRYVNKPIKTPNIKNIFYEYEVTQGLFNKAFFTLEGKKFKHLRNLCNKYDPIIEIKKDYNFEEVNNLLEKWKDKIGDSHYNWNVHIGYDKRFLKESIHFLKEKVIPLFFYIDTKLVGYAIFDKGKKDSDGIYNYTYLLGKYDPDYPNLSRYLDYKSYEFLFYNKNIEFKVNLGTASKGLLKYKTQTFPTYALEKRYFYKREKKEC